MARIILPHTEVKPGVREALRATGLEWSEFDVSGSDNAYWDLLSQMWRRRDTIVIIEQDIIVRPDSIDEMLDCTEEWCAFSYPYLAGTYPGLGCAKFEGSLLQRWPDVMDHVATMSNDDHPRKHYCTLDAFMRSTLMGLGVIQHVHGPPVGHWRPYTDRIPQPTHGCCQA